jgi:hypothetical protein
MKKLKKLSIVVFEPEWGKNDKIDPRHPLKYGEQVVYLGDIPNAIGHCAVAKWSGEVVWLVHPQDFREATEDEV